MEPRNSARRHRTASVRAVWLLLACLTVGREALLVDAAPLSAAIQGQGSLEGSVVILAEADDAPGQGDLPHLQALAQAVERYYAANAYGCVHLAFRFVTSGTHAWYNVGPRMSAYEGREEHLAVAAVQRALAASDLPERVFLDRVVVVFACNTSLRLHAVTCWMHAGFAIEVPGVQHTTRVYVQDLVVLSENDTAGTWAHEMGHTLAARYATPSGHLRLMDRYAYDPSPSLPNELGPWDLMGSGAHWGTPQGSAPTHMSSYTKEAAGWLEYAPAQFDTDYALTAVENQKEGATVLKLQDPENADSRCYYLIEARDSDAPYGAPASGVVLYHVAYDDEARHATVEIIASQTRPGATVASDAPAERPTLYGAGRLDGATEYVNTAAGFTVTLTAEAFTPYTATVRLTRCAPQASY